MRSKIRGKGKASGPTIILDGGSSDVEVLDTPPVPTRKPQPKPRPAHKKVAKTSGPSTAQETQPARNSPPIRPGPPTQAELRPFIIPASCQAPVRHSGTSSVTASASGPSPPFGASAMSLPSHPPPTALTDAGPVAHDNLPPPQNALLTLQQQMSADPAGTLKMIAEMFASQAVQGNNHPANASGSRGGPSGT